MILRFDPEKNFLPKIEFFRSRGASSSDISQIISSCPNILRRSLCNQLIPSFNFFRDLLQNDGIVIKALKHYSGILLEIDNFVMPNMVSLREVGVPESSITKLLRFYPKAITISPVRFKEILVEVKEMKFNPLSFVFLSAVRTLALMSKSTWREKVDTFKKWGWSDNDILVAFRSRPLFIVTSDDKIDAVMDLLVNKLNCEPSTISRYSSLLTMSLNKRLVPRAAVLQVLLSNGKVKKERKLTVFFYTESVFLEKFVMCHEKEASELLKLYQAQLKLAW